MISVRNLSRSYGSFKAVDDVSFDVGQGQVVGLLGPNGAGKTTVMKMLTGFHFPESGTITVGGFDVLQQTREAQALIGYLPESSPVYLDEPTTGLDPHQILEFRELIHHLGREKTVILSTHIMQEVEALCERVLIMNEGHIVAEGKAEDIAKQLQGESRYELRLKGLKGAAALESLAKLQGLKDAPRLVEDGAEPLLSCAFPVGASGGEALFDWAVAQKVKLLSLVPQIISLEDLFVQLTKETGE